MQHKTSYLKSFDNTQLFVQDFLPDSNIKALIVLVHGIGEHSSRYINWAKRFVKVGFAFITFDQRGHGLSEGKRGVISSYNDFLNDIDLILLTAEKKYPNLPIILYGHSMGGGEVLNHLLIRNSNYFAAIATSPWIISQASPAKVVIPIIRFFDWLVPKITIKTKFDSSQLSHNPDVACDYDNDERVHRYISFRLFIQAYDAGYQILNTTNKTSKPLLLMHGSSDEVTDAYASEKFAKKNHENCTFKMWNNGFHELHNEIFNDEVFDYIYDWISILLKK